MSKFLAHLWKMKYIRRWGLMRNVESENLHEHSWQVAVVAHMLAVMHNQDSATRVDPYRVATLALFHEVSEAIVGDLPTPIKYFNTETRRAFHALEKTARQHLWQTLPDTLQTDYRDLVLQDDTSELEATLIKAADRICAYIKCRQELKFGNKDFELAEKAVLRRMEEMHLPEADRFLDQFLESFELTIDQLNQDEGDKE